MVPINKQRDNTSPAIYYISNTGGLPAPCCTQCSDATELPSSPDVADVDESCFLVAPELPSSPDVADVDESCFLVATELPSSPDVADVDNSCFPIPATELPSSPDMPDVDELCFGNSIPETDVVNAGISCTYQM